VLPLSGRGTVWCPRVFYIYILQYDAIFCILWGSSDAASSFDFISKVLRVNHANFFFFDAQTYVEENFCRNKNILICQLKFLSVAVRK